MKRRPIPASAPPESPRVPAEAIHPSEYIRDEMEARGWTVDDLAVHSGILPLQLRALLEGRCRLSLIYAHCLGVAFGTGQQVWINLDAAARAQRVKGEADPAE